MYAAAIFKVRLAVLLAALALAGPSFAGEPACDLAPARAGTVASVVDARTVTLKDGETVRLAGVLPPELAGGWKGDPARTDAGRARAALESLVAGREVRLAVAGRERDRHGRLLAHLFVANGPERVWVQGRLAEQGHSRVYSLPGSRACVRALQAREARARAARAGIWAGSYFAVVEAGRTDMLEKRRYRFQIVEGRVLSTARLRKWTFVNFGADYKTDFTVAIAARDRKAFAGSDVPLDALEGKRIRVRGWLERWNGPVIKATHPEQIELLDVAAPEPEPGAQKENPAPAAAPGSIKL